MPRPRVLIAGPLFAPDRRGGMPIVFDDVAKSLEERGWSVEIAMTPDALGLSDHSSSTPLVPWAAPLWRHVPRLRSLDPDVRIALQHLLQGTARQQSAVLTALARRLEADRPDVVIAFAARENPGIAAFIISRHPNVLLFSFDGLAAELRQARWLRAARAIGVVVNRRLHPFVYQPIDPRLIRMAVFASESLREDAVRAGLPPAATRAIYFGVKCPTALPEAAPPAGRLLWVGRCSPEKGLHTFLDAVALLHRTRNVTLTAVAGPGPEDYRAFVLQKIARLNLASAVRLLPAVPHHDLPSVYAAHDVLLFQSPFAEPVALVLMEAFAAGLPVVAPHPVGHAVLVRPDATCIAFASPAPADVAAAITRALDDGALRHRVRRQAHELILQKFSIQRAGDAYDQALRELLGSSGRVAEPVNM